MELSIPKLKTPIFFLKFFSYFSGRNFPDSNLNNFLYFFRMAAAQNVK